MRKKIFSNTVWLLMDKVIRMILGLVVSILMARMLGVEVIGKWSFSESFYGMFLIFVTLGLDVIVIKELIKHPDKENEILGSAFTLKFAGTIFLVVLSQLILFILDQDESSKLLILILSLSSIFQTVDVIDYYFRSKLLSKFTVFSKSVSFILVSFLRIFLIYKGYSLLIFALTYILEYLIYSLFMMKLYFRKDKTIFRWSPKLQTMKDMLSSSWPLVISSIAIMIQARIDQVMIGQILGDKAVAQYSVALRLIEVLGFLPVVIANSFASVISTAKITDENEYKNSLRNLYNLMFLCFLGIGIPLFCFSEKIVFILYGAEFKEAGVLLSLFAIRLLFTNYGVARGLFIVNENLMKYTLFTSIIGAILNITLNTLFIPIYGSKGAILATIISFTVSIFIIDFFNIKAKENAFLMVKSMIKPWKFK